MRTGKYGCIWVYMGAVGHTITNAQAHNTKRDRNGLAGYDPRPCMAGKFPQKRHMCVCRHKGVRRDSGGWGWVRMGAGGCIGTQQHKTRQTDAQIGPQVIILARVCVGKLANKDDEVGT